MLGFWAETWNGTNWTEVNDLNTAKYYLGGFGTNTSSLCLGGASPSLTANVEQWNGTNWTEVANLSAAASGVSGAGTTSDGLAFGGYTTTVVATTEVWNAPTAITVTFTDS